MTLTEIMPTLQLSIGPVILISGVGLILLSLTNRYGRVIDRVRYLARDLPAAKNENRVSIQAQLKILSKRARLARAGIALAGLSVLLSALLVITLFLGALLRLPMATAIVFLFVLCMISLIGSLLLFLTDINYSLKALWLEMPPEGHNKDLW